MNTKISKDRATREALSALARSVSLSSKASTIAVTPTAPVEIDKEPFDWKTSSRGTKWCDCGSDCEVTRDAVLHFAKHVIEDAEWMTHDEVVYIAMDMWNYYEVCEFFLMGVNKSAKIVNGLIAEKYPFERGLEIVGHFSKTWNGCPDEICDTVLSRD